MGIKDDVFERELYKKDNIMLMNNIAKKFDIPHDELEQCKRIALWKALLVKNTKYKFSTILCNKLKWECLIWIKNNNRQRVCRKTEYSYPDISIDWLDELCSLPDDIKEAVHDRYFADHTLSEIAKKQQCCIETIRLKIIRGLSLLQKRLNGV